MKKKIKEVLTPLQQVIKRIGDPYAFGYGAAEIEYDSYYACEHGSDCCQHDYCRCGVIRNARVVSVDASAIVAKLTEDIEKDMLLCYCVDRVLRSSKALEMDSWEVNVTGGYYGEEVHGVKLDDKVHIDLIQSLQELESLTPTERVKKLLEWEYGYVLPRLADFQNVRLVQADLNDVKLFNNEYLRKISKEAVDFYKDYNLPRGVCVKEGTCYSLVDGYHRMLSAQKNKHERVLVVEMF